LPQTAELQLPSTQAKPGSQLSGLPSQSQPTSVHAGSSLLPALLSLGSPSPSPVSSVPVSSVPVSSVPVISSRPTWPPAQARTQASGSGSVVATSERNDEGMARVGIGDSARTPV
jgi:hypothetical protein